MMKLLDLFCGAGGAAMGYYQSGFTDIIGIDIVPQPRYPFDFIQADALHPPVNLGGFDLIHASPPCQKYSWAAKRWRREYPDLIGAVRDMLSGYCYVIENVIGAPLRNPIMLCGTMFDLKVIRHRLFEINPPIKIPSLTCRHAGTVKNGDYFTVAGHGGNSKDCKLKTWQEAMGGIGWMTRQEITQAIPPAYTEYIGKWLQERNKAKF